MKAKKPYGPKWHTFFRAWLRYNQEAQTMMTREGRSLDEPWTAIYPTKPGSAARRFKMSPGTTFDWYHGNACPHWNSAGKIAKLMNVSCADVLRSINATRGVRPRRNINALIKRISNKFQTI